MEILLPRAHLNSEASRWRLDFATVQGIPSAEVISYVLLSGGYDSTTALAWLASESASPSTIFVDYGQAARGEERRAAAAVAEHYGVVHTELAVSGLMVSDGEIRGRNALLTVLALSAAPAGTITIAIHAGSAYWDCGADFISLMQALADGYTGGALQIAVPFAGFSKADVYALGRDLGVPESLTYSCERAGPPCGECASCRDQASNART